MVDYKKAVVIAKDVLAKIAAGKIRPKSGVYVESIDFEYARKGTTSLKTIFSRVIEKEGCSSCALGSLFVSAVCKYNGAKIDVDNYESDLQPGSTNFDGPLTKIFSKSQLDLIEACFEGNCIDNYNSNRAYLSNTTIEEWHDFFNSSEERLIAICKNIIKNNGKFIPVVKTIEVVS